MYWPVVEYHARRFQNIDYRAEFDDLVQEGAEALWQCLEAGHTPSNSLIQNAMKDWIRFVTHRGLANDPLAG